MYLVYHTQELHIVLQILDRLWQKKLEALYIFSYRRSVFVIVCVKDTYHGVGIWTVQRMSWRPGCACPPHVKETLWCSDVDVGGGVGGRGSMETLIKASRAAGVGASAAAWPVIPSAASLITCLPTASYTCLLPRLPRHASHPAGTRRPKEVSPCPAQ